MGQRIPTFWQLLDQLCATSSIIVDRPKGSKHPRYPEYSYPLDYGYLKDTVSADGSGIDLWLGTAKTKQVTAVITSIDLEKRDSEIKLLYACTEAEISMIFEQHNATSMMKGILNVRPKVNKKIFLGAPITMLTKTEQFESLITGILADLRALGFEVSNAHEVEQFGRITDLSDSMIVERNLKWIEQTDVCVFLYLEGADKQSMRSDEVNIELGYAIAKSKDIVLVMSQEIYTNSSPMLRGIKDMANVRFVPLADLTIYLQGWLC